MDTSQKEITALASEHSLLRTLIDNLPDCIYAKDAKARKVIANPADLENLGCRTEAEATVAVIDGLLLMRQLLGPAAANRAAARLGIR